MSQPDIQKQLEEAVGLHVAGKKTAAAAIYDRILGLDGRNFDALNLRALIAHDFGLHEQAVALFDRAIKAFPGFAEAHFNRALTLVAMGRRDDALNSYENAVRARPNYADAHVNYGTLLHDSGRLADAIAAFRQMAGRCPNDPRAHYNLGVCLSKTLTADDPTASAEAVNALQRALALHPAYPDALLALANVHVLQRDFEKAIPHFQQALGLNPPWSDDLRAEVLSDLGEHLRKARRLPESVAAHQKAVALRPNRRAIRFNLGAALYDAGLLAEAEAAYKSVIAIDPNYVKAYVNLANTYRDQNRIEDAISLLELSLTIEPTRHGLTTLGATLSDLGWFATSLMVHERAANLEDADETARFNRAVVLLGVGKLADAWPGYELRFNAPSVDTIRFPEPPPYWNGEDLTGRGILVWTEQGLGDEIIYSSMIPELLSRAERCLIECAERMAPIFRRSFPAATVVGRKTSNTTVAPREGWDYQIGLASLGRFFRPDMMHFPRHQGYLKADPDKVRALRSAYETLAEGRRIVGIAWRSRNPKIGGSKTADLMHMAPILRVPGVMFVNLQYGDCAADLQAAKENLDVTIHHDASINQLTDMDGFFAQVAAMDFVVTTSNTTVHVAGSQNIPTWLIVPHAKGTLWYWFRRRTDSPWYPSVTIARDEARRTDGPWEHEPIRRVADDLRAAIARLNGAASS